MSRPIRSYVLRQGRTTAAQQRAVEALTPKYGIPYAEALIDARTLFGRAAPLVVEIGSGMGETTLEIARTDPATDFIAIEVHGPGVGSLLRGIEVAGPASAACCAASRWRASPMCASSATTRSTCSST